MQALHTPILLPSIARPIWNYCSLQRLHVSIYLACSILLNFLICSQLTAEIGSNIAIVRACREKGGINAKIGIALKEGIRALSGGALFGIYSGGVYK